MLTKKTGDRTRETWAQLQALALPKALLSRNILHVPVPQLPILYIRLSRSLPQRWLCALKKLTRKSINRGPVHGVCSGFAGLSLFLNRKVLLASSPEASGDQHRGQGGNLLVPFSFPECFKASPPHTHPGKTSPSASHSFHNKVSYSLSGVISAPIFTCQNFQHIPLTPDLPSLPYLIYGPHKVLCNSRPTENKSQLGIL